MKRLFEQVCFRNKKQCSIVSKRQGCGDASSSILLVVHQYLRAEDDYDVISGSEVRFDIVDGEQKGKKMTKRKSVKQKPSEVLRGLLSHLCREQRLTSVQITLEILHGMHMSIARKPSQEKFYRIYTKGREFESYVWKKEICRLFLKQVGWHVCGSFIVLSRSKSIEEPLNCIQEAKREVEQLLKNKPQSSKERPSPNGVLNAVSPKLEDRDIPLGKSLSLKDPKNKLKNSSSEGGIDSTVYREDYVDLDDSFNSTSSNEETLESSEGYIGDENYLIVDFAAAKSKEKPASTLPGMEDLIYGKDGRRRRRLQEKGELSSEDSIQAEGVPLRQRTRQRGSERSTGIESERNSATKNTTAPQLQREVQTTEPAADDLYDERGRRRRNRRDRSTRDDPPADEATSRGSGMHRLAARETTTTSTTATDKSERQLDEVQKSLKTKHTISVEKNYLSPGDTIMAEDDITQDSSIAVKSNRVEGLQRESTDSSGSDSGKKKKLVLKRGSMRRKKIQEEEKIVEASESSDTNMTSGVKQISGVTTDSSVTDKFNEDSSEPCQQSEAKINKNISDRIESINANFGKEGSTKKSQKSEEVNGDAVDGAISIKSRIANLMANMNSVEGGKDKAASESGPASDKTLNNKPETTRDHLTSSEDVKGVKDGGKEGKGEKKRKLVLKVKRKKNHKLNDNNKETIETSPAGSCDSKHIDSTGKEEISSRGMGGENEPRGRGIEHKVREESNREDNEQHSNLNQRIANGTRESPKVERDIPNRDIRAVKIESTLAEKEIKFESNGHSNSRNDTKAVVDYSRTEDKNSINYKQEKNNGVIEVNDTQGDIEKVAEDAGKPKKKKFVLKRKKK